MSDELESIFDHDQIEEDESDDEKNETNLDHEVQHGLVSQQKISEMSKQTAPNGAEDNVHFILSLPGSKPKNTATQQQQNPALSRRTISTSHRNAFDIDIDEIEPKPWRMPGADISQYFNYDLNEESWTAYRKKYLEKRDQNKQPQQQQD